MGARRDELDRLVCVAGMFELARADDDRLLDLTMLEAVEYGWWYTARLPGGQATAAVATSPEIFRQIRVDGARAWQAALQKTRHVAARLHAVQAQSASDRLAVYLAPSFVLDPMHCDRWLAVGYAAASYDPISSQGIHKALADGIAGARALAAWLAGRADALDDNAAGVRRRFDDHARQRRHFYGQEQRWPAAPIWRGRRAAGEPRAVHVGPAVSPSTSLPESTSRVPIHAM